MSVAGPHLHNQLHREGKLPGPDLVPGGRYANVPGLPTPHPAHVLLAKESSRTQVVVVGVCDLQRSPPNHNAAQRSATIWTIVIPHANYQLILYQVLKLIEFFQHSD